jgi:very-short-patch-repair endonuclease
MRQKSASGVVIAAMAGRQHGVISTQQLRAAGLSLSGISRRVRDGRLHRVHQGVYAVGHSARFPERRWMAAVLACGGPSGAGRLEEPEAGSVAARRAPSDRGNGTGKVDGAAMQADAGSTMTVLDYWGAALSHRSAAELWGLLSPEAGPIDVSISGYGGRKRRKGIRVHRSQSLLPAAVTLRGGIPVTTPARTVADLRHAAAKGRRQLISPRELRRAIRQADVFGLPLGAETARDRTRSDLERDFLRLCRRHRLPAPEVNVRIGRHLVDFLWGDRRLVVETDGYRYHRGRAAFEDDRARDLALRALGYEVLRLSARQLTEEPNQIADVIGHALARFSSDRPETRHAAP